MDIAGDLERFLIESSKRLAFNDNVRYFANGLLDYQCGINVIHQQFELKQDDNPSETFPQWNFYMDMTLNWSLGRYGINM